MAVMAVVGVCLLGVSCGSSASTTPVPTAVIIEKEVVKRVDVEVPVIREVVREVAVEVPRDVIIEKQVVKTIEVEVEKPIIQEVQV